MLDRLGRLVQHDRDDPERELRLVVADVAGGDRARPVVPGLAPQVLRDGQRARSSTYVRTAASCAFACSRNDQSECRPVMQ